MGSGSFQRLPASPPLNFVCEALTLSLPLPRWDPAAGGVPLCSALSPPAPWLCREPPAAPRPAVAFSEREFPGAPQSAPRAPRPRSSLQPRCRGGSSRMGNISCGSGVNSRT